MNVRVFNYLKTRHNIVLDKMCDRCDTSEQTNNYYLVWDYITRGYYDLCDTCADLYGDMMSDEDEE
jgi:hypothetical protein